MAGGNHDREECGKEFGSFAEFYPFYLSEHSDPLNRRLHFAGCVLVIASLLSAVIFGEWLFFLLAPVFGYGLAWVGHFFVEKNRPATFKYPLWSLMGDWAMFGEIVTGKIRLQVTAGGLSCLSAAHSVYTKTDYRVKSKKHLRGICNLMPKLLVFQHVAHEILGTLDPLLRGSGFRIKYVNFERYPDYVPMLSGYDGLIVLGGPMNVDETGRYPFLKTEVRVIEKAIESDMPVLGICLGSQLIAKTLGSRVRKNREKEIGWYDVTPNTEGASDPLLSHFSETEKIFQWHGDTFDVPGGGTLLASSELCENQAFRYGDNVYGFQFHMEVDERMVERWLGIPENRKEIEEAAAIDPEKIRKDTPVHISRLKELSDASFAGFVNLFGFSKKRLTLPSR